MITRKQILEKAIETYGVEPQINQFHEEVGELMRIINKVRRCAKQSGLTVGYYFEYGVPRPQQNTTTGYALQYNELCGEVADVQIMLDQLKLMLNQDTIDLIEERKIERLKERLKM